MSSLKKNLGHSKKLLGSKLGSEQWEDESVPGFYAEETDSSVDKLQVCCYLEVTHSSHNPLWP